MQDEDGRDKPGFDGGWEKIVPAEPDVRPRVYISARGTTYIGSV
jgi:hypothetical protein